MRPSDSDKRPYVLTIYADFLQMPTCDTGAVENPFTLISLNKSHVLTKVKLQRLNINDISIDIIGHYGITVTNLALGGLHSIKERGFWVMGVGIGMQKMDAFSISVCNGVSDLGLQVIYKGFPNLKVFCIQRSVVLSDNGLDACVKALV
ncbi:hypothetical protein MTR67_047944 [Solanum verrucosum]|uniref:Uncharacterized protein n=1 Tax=Solanum verrucosum TaxID=315347 RepID=A0AAF0ZZJ1_SOLVR|nr:hypothetical protein MTR67_047944 [Solanum verrucosum]